MSITETNSPLYPPPPRLTGEYQVDNLVLSDYNSSIYQALTTPPPGSIDPNNLPDPSNSTISQAQLTANIAMQFALSINTALGTAGVSGFPLTPPTTETGSDS
ncbi:MAG: hypothetical protein ABSA68_13415 [Xanthobacteraceae bacterium]|jgi:hypothetical protein